jgi:hypothetical protein
VVIGRVAKRATLITAEALLFAWETKTGKHTWRQQSDETRRHPYVMDHGGYGLSAIELLATGGKR